MNVAASFATHSFAVDAVTALEQHLKALLVVADVIASLGDHVASSEMHRALDRALLALLALREQLATIEIIEDFLKRRLAGGSWSC